MRRPSSYPGEIRAGAKLVTFVSLVVGAAALGCAPSVSSSQPDTAPRARGARSAAPDGATRSVRVSLELDGGGDASDADAFRAVESTCRGQPSVLPREGVSFHKGQIHVHTAKSFDAITPVREVLQFYQKRGYEFVAVTDHNHVTTPRPFSRLLLVPGVELTYNANRCEPQPPPGNLCAFHTNVLFLDPRRDSHHGHYFNPPLRRTRDGALEWEMKLAADLHGIPVLNHPTYQEAIDVPTIEKFVRQGLRFVEFFNGSVLDAADDRAKEVARLEAMWDQVLSDGMLVYATAGDDAHHFSDADWVRRHGKKPKLGDRAWVYVRSTLSLPALQSAMLAGDFYCSTGVRFERLERSSQYLYVRVARSDNEQVRVRFIGKGGRVLSEQQGPDACYRARGDELYIRAVATSSRGGRAWTQAVFLQSQETVM